MNSCPLPRLVVLVIPTDEPVVAIYHDHNLQLVLVESVAALRQELSRQQVHRFPVRFVR